jgi:hypothetical protein
MWFSISADGLKSVSIVKLMVITSPDQSQKVKLGYFKLAGSIIPTAPCRLDYLED